MSDLSEVKIPSLRGKVSPEEWKMRVEVAACYRLVAHFGLNDLVYNQDRKSTRLNSSHIQKSRMPSSA